MRRGLARARYGSAVLLLPVDLAHLEVRELRRMILRWCGSRRRVIARRIGDHGGTPLILPRWLCAQASRVSGDRGLKELVGRLAAAERTLVHLPSAQWDIDTPQDLAHARRRVRARA